MTHTRNFSIKTLLAARWWSGYVKYEWLGLERNFFLIHNEVLLLLWKLILPDVVIFGQAKSVFTITTIIGLIKISYVPSWRGWSKMKTFPNCLGATVDQSRENLARFTFFLISQSREIRNARFARLRWGPKCLFWKTKSVLLLKNYNKKCKKYF